MIYAGIKIYCGPGSDTVHKCSIGYQNTDTGQNWDDSRDYPEGDGQFKIENGVFTIQSADLKDVLNIPLQYVFNVLIARIYHAEHEE